MMTTKNLISINEVTQQEAVKLLYRRDMAEESKRKIARWRKVALIYNPAVCISLFVFTGSLDYSRTMLKFRKLNLLYIHISFLYKVMLVSFYRTFQQYFLP